MSAINEGGQLRTFQFKHDATSHDFNNVFTGLIDPGVYRGGELINPNGTGGNDIQINPFVCLIDATDQISIKIQTTQPIMKNIATYVDGEYSIIAAYDWQEVIDNYADIIIRERNSPISNNEIIIGTVIKTSSVISELSYRDKYIGINTSSVGNLNDLETTEKTVVGAINELKTRIDTLHP